MRCANCEALRAQVGRLERELGLRQKDGEIAALMRAFDVSSSGARVLLALNAAKGQPVTTERLLHTSGFTEGSLRSTIHRMRSASGLPADAVEALKRLGYRLTPAGLSAVLAAIQPPEIQDARG